MTYQAAIEYLTSLQMFGLVPGLDNTLWLARACGNPQEKLRFIHVAGTNGKGSVCALLEAVYRHAGRRVGLYTSPHLVSFTERIQINRQPIAPDAVARWVETLRRQIERDDADRKFTFFEVVTVLALLHFAAEQCDLVIWETGLGGRLDATNIVTPLASVITNIERDHQEWLGDTFEKIAAEKAGIIKPGLPVITAAASDRGLDVIAATAGRLGCPLTIIEPAHLGPDAQRPETDHSSIQNPKSKIQNRLTAWSLATANAAGPMPELTLRGLHQRTNAAVALGTIAALAVDQPVSADAIRAGLATADWPGRMQLVPGPPGRVILLDGAHNPDSARALRESLAAEFPREQPTLVLGVLSDKDWRAIVETLAPAARRIVTVPVNNQRTLASVTLAEACRAVHASIPVVACASLAEALDRLEPTEFVVLTGSLYLVGEAMERLGVLSGPEGGERHLNEWSGQADRSLEGPDRGL